jgi:hypothetical protein
MCEVEVFTARRQERREFRYFLIDLILDSNVDLQRLKHMRCITFPRPPFFGKRDGSSPE